MILAPYGSWTELVVIHEMYTWVFCRCTRAHVDFQVMFTIQNKLLTLTMSSIRYLRDLVKILAETHLM